MPRPNHVEWLGHGLGTDDNYTGNNLMLNLVFELKTGVLYLHLTGRTGV